MIKKSTIVPAGTFDAIVCRIATFLLSSLFVSSMHMLLVLPAVML
nr:MAG TPA: hypothetical protein [Caudoviricetes sp.]